MSGHKEKEGRKDMTRALASPTDELCHGVVLSLRTDGSCDAVVLQDGQEQLHKVRRVRRSDHVQNLHKERKSQEKGFVEVATVNTYRRRDAVSLCRISSFLMQFVYLLWVGWSSCVP